jgi:hypothetical protein
MISAREIVAAFGGGDVSPSGDVLVAAPGHNRRDRSLSIRPLPDGRVLVNTFSPRDDRLMLLRYVEAKLGIAHRGTAMTGIKQTATKSSPSTKPPSDPLALWRASVDPAGTPVETYLARRGVLEPAWAAFGHALRFHAACPFGGQRVPCMVALVSDIRTNKPQAVHRTAVDVEGNKTEIDGKSRMALGPIANGCVRLTEDENLETCLAIAEGTETALSLQLLPEFGFSPVWACLNAGNLAAFPVLPGIECLWIGVDNRAEGRPTQTQSFRGGRPMGRSITLRHCVTLKRYGAAR